MTGPAANVLFSTLVVLLLGGVRPSNALAAAPAKAGPQTQPQVQVQAALDLYAQALMTKDRDAFDRVLHPDLSYGHSSGLVETKTQAIEHVLGSTAKWESVTFDDTRIQVRGETAYVTGKVQFRQRGPSGKETVIKLVALHVFVKAAGRPGWQMIARQATRPPEPAPAK